SLSRGAPGNGEPESREERRCQGRLHLPALAAAYFRLQETVTVPFAERESSRLVDGDGPDAAVKLARVALTPPAPAGTLTLGPPLQAIGVPGSTSGSVTVPVTVIAPVPPTIATFCAGLVTVPARTIVFFAEAPPATTKPSTRSITSATIRCIVLLSSQRTRTRANERPSRRADPAAG